MGLLNTLEKYAAYFHDGSVFNVIQENDHIIFWMESAQIPPEDMADALAFMFTQWLQLKTIACEKDK